MTIARAILAGFLLGLLPAAAQDDIIETEFLTLSFNGTVKGFYYRNGKEISKLEASRQGISAPIAYRGSSVLSLYENETDLAPPEKGREPPKPVLQVLLPANNDRVLLLFTFADAKSPLPTLRALGISTTAMKEGDYRIFNLSKQDVFAILNEQKASIAPGKSNSLTSAAWRGGVMDMNVSFGLRKEDGQIRPVYSSVWGHRPVRRMFVFIFDRPDKFRPLDIRMFYDVPKIKAAKAKVATSTADETPE
jgi:hypothetical protein